MTHRLSALAGVAVLAILLTSGAAQAHAHLVTADPAAGASVKASPKTLRASFSEDLVEQFSGLTLTTDKGVSVAVGKVTLDPKDRHTLIAPVGEPLAPGNYIVEWRAVSADTHRMTGHYDFRVTP